MKNKLYETIQNVAISAAVLTAMYGVPVGAIVLEERKYQAHTIDGTIVAVDTTNPTHIVLGIPGNNRTQYWDDNNDGTLDRALSIMSVVPRGRLPLVTRPTPETSPKDFARANALYARVRTE